MTLLNGHIHAAEPKQQNKPNKKTKAPHHQPNPPTTTHTKPHKTRKPNKKRHHPTLIRIHPGELGEDLSHGQTVRRRGNSLKPTWPIQGRKGFRDFVGLNMRIVKRGNLNEAG